MSADQTSLESRERTNSVPLNEELHQSVIKNFYGTIPQVRLDPILAEMKTMAEKQGRAQEAMDELRVKSLFRPLNASSLKTTLSFQNQMQQEYSYFNNILHEEKYRYQVRRNS